MRHVRAELLVLGRRSATWVLLGVTLAMASVLGYVLPYLSYTGRAVGERRPDELAVLLPDQVVATMLVAFPFWFGVLGLVLGVLAVGSDYGWDTVKTALLADPGRLGLLAGKLGALAAALLVAVGAVLAVAAACSLPIALQQDVTVDWPSAWDLARGVGAGALVLAVWTALGVLLAVATRGTTLAVGLGVLYGLVVEGLLSSFGQDIGLLDTAAEALLRTNGYSLVEPLGAAVTVEGGPGTFSGDLVGPWQASVVSLGYVAVFVLAAGWLLRRRDVT